jgi:hypothetical protein
MMDNYVINYDLIVDYDLIDEANGNNLLHQRFKKPNPIRFFPSMLHSNLATRRRQINRALNTFVIVMDVHIEGKTWYDSLDNVTGELEQANLPLNCPKISDMYAGDGTFCT